MRGANDFRPTELHILFKKGGLGDTVARLPAVRYILDSYQHITTIRLFLQDYAVDLATHLLNDGRVEVYGYSKMPALLEQYPDTPGMTTDSEHHTTLRTHLTDHAFHTLVDEVPPQAAKDYLRIRPDEIVSTIAPISKPYVVITTGFTADVREMLPAYVNEVASWIIANGRQVVFLGKKESEFWAGRQPPTEATFREEIEYSVGLDLRDKTSLLEAAKIMGEAEAVVGLDNGLLHLAACTDVPIIAGYTSVPPEIRMPYRNGELGWNVKPVFLSTKQLGCSGCQKQAAFVYGMDFRRCYYNSYDCIRMLTPDLYKEQLYKVFYES